MSDPHHALARALGEPAAVALMPFLRRRDFGPGEPVLRHGERAQAMFFLCSGTVVAQSDDSDSAVSFGTVAPGAWLGEIGLLDGGPATATVVATEPVVALELDQQGFARLQTEDPRTFSVLLSRITRELAARLRRTTQAYDKAVVPEEPSERRGWFKALLSMLAIPEVTP